MDKYQNNLNSLLHSTGMWRAASINPGFQPGIPTGYAALDQLLPGNGWPGQGLTELLYRQPGIGELRLLGPGLAHLSQQDKRRILLINPPFIPYAPGLAGLGIHLSSILVVRPETAADSLWVAEKALASESCCAVLLWPDAIATRDVRRLQLAGKSGQCLGILFRPARTAKQASPAELRIELKPGPHHDLDNQTCLHLSILKRRGGWATELTLQLQDDLNKRTPYFPELSVPLQSPALPFQQAFSDPDKTDRQHGLAIQ